MKSNMKKRIIAVMLCMAMLASYGSYALAEGEAGAVQESSQALTETGQIAEKAEAAALAETPAVQTETAEAETPAVQEQTPAQESAPAAADTQTAQTQTPAAADTQAAQTQTPAAETQTPATQTQAAAPEVKHQDALELKQEIRDADGTVLCTVTANIEEGTFDANTAEVSMKVSTIDQTLTDEITDLAKKKLASDKELGGMFLYKVEFQVNGATAEPGKEVKLTFQPKDFQIDDAKKATVFYYNEANSPAGNTEAEIVEIIQKQEQIEALQAAGGSIDTVDENYDLTEISLKADGTADKIVTEGRRSTVYGCYLEEQKPEEVKEEPAASEEVLNPSEEVKTETPKEDNLLTGNKDTAEDETDVAKETEEESLKSLDFENEKVTVTVTEVEAGAIPDGAELKVVPILEDDEDTADQYKEVEEQIQKKAEEDEKEIEGFLAYDITFVDEDGNEMEPNSEVKVTMEYKKPAIPTLKTTLEIQDKEVSVLHLEEDGDGNVAQVVDMNEAGQLDEIKTGDYQQVEKVEMRTESFSAYTIYWYYDGSFQKKVEIHYVDTKGNSLDNLVNGGNINEYAYTNGYNSDLMNTIKLSESRYNVLINGYSYRYSSISGSSYNKQTETKIEQLKIEKAGRYSKAYQIYYKPLEGDWKGISTSEKVYMVYEKSSSEDSGGGSSETSELAHRKYVEKNVDGTYNLTLNVTGAIGTEENPAEVEVVFALDLSNSMDDNGYTNLNDAKKAAETLITSLTSQKSVNSKWKLVGFGSSAETITPDWISASNMQKLINNQDVFAKYKGDTKQGGTNYEAALKETAKAINDGNDQAIKIVIFLTDGQPTYHGDNTKGGNTYTNEDDYNGALNGARTIICDQFYAIGMDLPSDISDHRASQYEEHYGKSGEELLNDICSYVTATKTYFQDVDENEDLSDVFGKIAGDITYFTAESVNIVDKLTDEVDVIGNPIIQVKNGAGDDVTQTEITAGEITANYNTYNKTLNLNFNENYYLRKDYTYSVTVKIKPNENATQKFIENGYQYPDTGEEGTGDTSAGKPGIFSNVENSAKVTWETGGEKKEGTYNRPVVQLATEPVKVKTEPVNFYLNLSSQILDISGNITGQDQGNFTTSVSGDQSDNVQGGQGCGVPINTDLVVIVPDDHQHPEDLPVGDDGQQVLGVIGGTSTTSALEVDRLIRALGEPGGTQGNQTGQTDKTYQIVNGNGTAYFPNESEIFQYIRDNWSTESGKGVNKGKQILVNGQPIDKDKLTTENFTIRWYVFKDQVADCWHIDGILVPQSGVLNITKTFENQDIANLATEKGFAIKVTGNFLGTTENTTITETITEDTVITTNEDGTVTYSWSLAIFGEEYEVSELNYNFSSNDWKYSSTKYVYRNIIGKETEGDSTSVKIPTDCQFQDETPKPQTLAFTNYYTTKLDLYKVSENGESFISGAKFELAKKTESGFVSEGDLIEVVQNGEAELQNLVPGVVYRLVEKQAPDSHMLLTEPIYIIIDKGGDIKLCNEDGEVQESQNNSMWWLSDNGKLMIKNNILYELPSSGGPGIYWYLFGGVLLMMAASLMVYKNKRREVLKR